MMPDCRIDCWLYTNRLENMSGSHKVNHNNNNKIKWFAFKPTQIQIWNN